MRDLYFAACSTEGGIYHYKFDDGKIEFIKKYDMDRPMYLAISGNKMYVILREVFDSESGVASFDIADDGSLNNMTVPVSARGRCACHLCVDGENVYTANYLSGSVSWVEHKIAVHTGQGPNKPRQDMAHCHYVNLTADGKYLLVCDLGNDTIYTYDKELNEISRAKVPEGDGCRHLVMSHKYNVVYCVNELASTVSVFDINDGVLTLGETYSALSSDFKGKNTAAAIRLSGDERYLYTSNRGDDSICVFKIKENGRKLENLGYVKVAGESPRDFDIVDGYMFVTNEVTNNVTIFKETGDGRFEKRAEELEMPGPLCVVYR